MTKEELKAYFGSTFQGMENLLEKLLSPIFGEFEAIKYPKHNDYEPQYGNGSANIEHIYDYGSYTIEGAPVSVWEVVLADNCHISRARKNVQEVVRRLMGNYTGAFVVFHYEKESTNSDKDTWRLSWVKRLDKNSTTTTAKRYTYLCGPGYSCRTIAERFEKLKAEGNRTLDTVTKAFDAEALSDEFFAEYKVLYDDIVQWITGQRIVKRDSAWKTDGVLGSGPDKNGIYPAFKELFDNDDEKATKAVRDYVKKLMGRLVFIQFLQKKGYLGINGRMTTNFLMDLFNGISEEKQDDFIETALEQVVYLLLNNETRAKDADKIDDVVLNVPFLNGGLFEPDTFDNINVKVPKEFFHNEAYGDKKREFGNTALRPADKMLTQCGILDLFNHYNFTIDENDPDDAEMGVDPEMLGKIFENLLEDNKDKGAFYTPKEIVQYMCRESLIAYLQTDIEDERTKDAIRQFVTTQEVGGKLPKDIDQKLRDVKICDPAIGSGAFPMGLLNLLVALREKLEPATNRCELKKDIIQRNIYGVDIERGAIDIARLRFWLSIMVDEEVDANNPKPTPLPNFDYKFMQGNSLLEQYKGIDLSALSSGEKVSMQTDIFQNNLKQYQSQLHSLIKLYYDTDNHTKKKELKGKIQDNVNAQMKESGVSVNFTELGIDVAGNDKFFLWHTWFKDVFDNGKFDIVIGNPPYGANIDNLIATYEGVFPNTSHGYKDIYKYFFDFSLGINKDNGVISFITPNTYLRQPRYGDLRRLLLSHSIIQILDLGEGIFKEAVVPVSITLVSNNQQFTTVKYVDLVKVINNDTACLLLSPIDFVLIKQETWKNTPNNIFVENNIVMSDDMYSLDDIFIMKDAGFKYQRHNVGLSNKGKNDLTQRIFYKGSMTKEDIRDIPILIGKDINTYTYNLYPDKVLRYNYESRLKENELTYFNKEIMGEPIKLIWRQTAPYFIGTILDQPLFFGNTIQAGIIKEEYKKTVSYEYLCGLLNSKYLRYLYEQIVKEGGRVYPQVKLEKLRPLPIIVSKNEFQEKIEALVKEIILTKKKTSETVFSNLESKIDLLVFHLYGLTYDEVLIVYGNEKPPFSREEYEQDNK